jgi:hypothetical protein
MNIDLLDHTVSDKVWENLKGEAIEVMYVDRIDGDSLMIKLSNNKSIFIVGMFESVEISMVSPYEDFEIDDKVFVWNYSNVYARKKRHFAGISKDGKPLAYVAGKTSWGSSDVDYKDAVAEWDYCAKA